MKYSILAIAVLALIGQTSAVHLVKQDNIDKTPDANSLKKEREVKEKAEKDSFNVFDGTFHKPDGTREFPGGDGIVGGCKGVFACGEVIDVDGVTGGFNFMGCWSTGYVAGNGAADYVMAKHSAANMKAEPAATASKE